MVYSESANAALVKHMPLVPEENSRHFSLSTAVMVLEMFLMQQGYIFQSQFPRLKNLPFGLSGHSLCKGCEIRTPCIQVCSSADLPRKRWEKVQISSPHILRFTCYRLNYSLNISGGLLSFFFFLLEKSEPLWLFCLLRPNLDAKLVF